MTRPAVFAMASFSDALARSKAEEKILIVDACAEWCGPCKAMDRSAWVDPNVVAWLSEHAVAFQFDVDEDEALAKELAIQAMPTLIAFKGGEPFDRVVGLQQPKKLLEWLEGLLRGETAASRAEARVKNGKASMRERLELAAALATQGRLDEATHEYAWLWEHALEHEPAFVGARFTFMAEAIRDLVRRHPGARERFAAMRDALLPSVIVSGPESEALGDWFSLNAMLDEPERTVRWFDAAKADLMPSPEALRLLELRVVPLLLERGRWADVGRLYRDPTAALRTALAHKQSVLASSVPQQLKAELEVLVRDQVVTGAAQLRACLLAAGRAAEAEAVATLARQAEGSSDLERAFERLERQALGARD